ncbi:MAG TPA: TonB-dependent receptor [Xanthobacteraceae bacterium]|nr:TonB-dependent receptor [Xanthobacteraceae bacterium]
MFLSIGRARLLTGSALVSLCGILGSGLAQTPPPANPPAQTEEQTTPQAPSTPGTLPPITVETSKQKPVKKKQVARKPPPPTQPSAETQQAIVERQIQTQVTTFNTARSNIFTSVGANNSNRLGKEDIQRLPQGENTPVERVLLQLPGVSQDSAASGNLHVRNEHANVAYRINGVMLPDGVSGLGSVLETGLIGNLTLLTGALPAEFGLRTAAVADITTRQGAFENGGTVGVYGGSHETLTTNVEYGGTVGGCTALPLPAGKFLKVSPSAPGDCGPVTQYFFTGRFYTSNLGIENPTPEPEAIHDLTKQWRGFGYISTIIDPTLRVSLLTGASLNWFQIPNNPGATAFPGITSSFGFTNLDSSKLDENQQERTYYNVLAVQKSLADLDFQISYFNRYSSLHFVPDTVGDLFFNGIASDVFRSTFANGMAGDGSYKMTDAHTLRAGFSVTAEKTQNTNLSTVQPCTSPDCTAFNDTPFTIPDSISKLGWLYGVYLQDEWRITDQLTMNAGLRFDQVDEYVSANQLSPRLNFVYTPLPGTTFHAGYARYFTPPPQTIAAPVNLVAFESPPNSGTPAVKVQDPVLPERANVFDAGVTQVFLSHGCAPMPSGQFVKAPPISPDCERLELGVDAYYKQAQDLLDDGQFGAALILDGFNYEKAYNEGVEASIKYRNGNFQAYGNVAWAIQKATNIVSNQFLFAQDELDFIKMNYIYTDHAQTWTGSAGLSYLYWGTLFTTDMIFGSGLRNGDHNSSHLPFYTQFNAGVSHEFVGYTAMPFTLRFDVVNVFDTVYEIRDGSGIGVFAPQFGPRRGYFAGWSSKL